VSDTEPRLSEDLGLVELDWASFLSEEDARGDWCVEPIIPAGGHVAIHATAKTGKSVLAADVAAAVATGRSVLGRPARDPASVLYVDMENPRSEIRDRMLSYGYTPASDLTNLHYLHMQNLPPLDTELGGAALADLADRYQAQLVVVDTVASSVYGPENDADTYRKFFRCSGRLLRARDVSLARLDHGGKDRTKGQRGSSAKNDDVDIVWAMSRVGDRITLKNTHSRSDLVPAEVRITRHREPLTAHVLEDDKFSEDVIDLAGLLDFYELPPDVTVRQALACLRQHGAGRRTDLVADAIRYRNLKL
jgi:hypothetical protein